MKKLVGLVLLFACTYATTQGLVFLPPDLAMPAGKIYIDHRTVQIQKRHGYSNIRVGSTGCGPTLVSALGSCGGSSYPGYVPGVGADGGPDTGGAFRTECATSHEGFDDPIVKPRQSGTSHLHTFFGNTTTDAQSNAAAMHTFGNSTCDGGIANRTGYWVPAMVYHCPSGEVGCDRARDGEIVHARGNLAYYKTQTLDRAHLHLIQWPPAGLRMVGGDANNTDPARSANVGSFECQDNGTGLDTSFGNRIPSTAEATALGTNRCVDIKMVVTFPECWNGTDLYLPPVVGGINSSHMQYTSYAGNCPDGMVSFPNISVNVIFPIADLADIDYWVLASDHGPEYGNTQSGSTTTQVKLALSASTADGHYVNGDLAISGQRRRITAYTGSTRTATLDSALSGAPAAGVSYLVRQMGGITIHADWANGWNQDPNFMGWGRTLTDQIIHGCFFDSARYGDPITALYSLDCHSDNIGDPALVGVPYSGSQTTTPYWLF